MYNVGDKVVNVNNLKAANVAQITEEKIQIIYQSGVSEWVSSGDVKKLLLEVDPKPDDTLL